MIYIFSLENHTKEYVDDHSTKENDLKNNPFNLNPSICATPCAPKSLQKTGQLSAAPFPPYLKDYRLRVSTRVTSTSTPKQSFFYAYNQLHAQEPPSHTFHHHGLTTSFHNHDISTYSGEPPDFCRPGHQYYVSHQDSSLANISSQPCFESSRTLQNLSYLQNFLLACLHLLRILRMVQKNRSSPALLKSSVCH